MAQLVGKIRSSNANLSSTVEKVQISEAESTRTLNDVYLWNTHVVHMIDI